MHVGRRQNTDGENHHGHSTVPIPYYVGEEAPDTPKDHAKHTYEKPLKGRAY